MCAVKWHFLSLIRTILFLHLLVPSRCETWPCLDAHKADTSLLWKHGHFRPIKWHWIIFHAAHDINLTGAPALRRLADTAAVRRRLGDAFLFPSQSFDEKLKIRMPHVADRVWKDGWSPSKGDQRDETLLLALLFHREMLASADRTLSSMYLPGFQTMAAPACRLANQNVVFYEANPPHPHPQKWFKKEIVGENHLFRFLRLLGHDGL